MKALSTILLTCSLILTGCGDEGEESENAKEAYGNFHNSFIGEGKVWDSSQSYDCGEVRYTFKLTEDSITLIEGTYKCEGGVEIEWEQLKLHVENGKLYFKGRKIGTINAEEVFIDVQQSNFILQQLYKIEGVGLYVREYQAIANDDGSTSEFNSEARLLPAR